ncbi:Cardiolipin synthase A [Moorella thermoacetica]|uniref:phospholipase D-like domain-containing protein n=1 Tax=Neomoorella thermoacetica TaxID=1525 RepID=UPI0008FA6B54|nr:phospholipase D-like domain-containing protein [Moorella thermoacetica]OIQ10640.1 cardiolipin synthase [Moorella thermoacetica]
MISILVTGESFVGRGIRSIGAVISELIRTASNEIQVVTYLLTSEDLVDLLVEAAQRGIKIYIVLDSLSGQPETVRSKLQAASSIFSYFTVKEFCKEHSGNLHAKTIICDRTRAIVGSANFTRAGMVSGNHEIAVLISGPEVARLARLIEAL